MQRKLAIFDVDGTIFRSSLTRSLFGELVKQGLFPAHAVQAVAPSLEAWLNRRGTYDAYIAKVVEVFLKYIKGVRQEDLRAVARAVLAQEKMRVYRYTRDLIRELKKKNYFIVAISGSPYEIVRLYNQFLKFNRSYGWVLATNPQGQYTGQIKYIYSVRDKKYLVNHVLKKYGVTLRGSIGVGDSESDVSFLKMVDWPIAFNPSSGLYRVAKRKEWEIVVERKDVVYKI